MFCLSHPDQKLHHHPFRLLNVAQPRHNVEDPESDRTLVAGREDTRNEQVVCLPLIAPSSPSSLFYSLQ